MMFGEKMRLERKSRDIMQSQIASVVGLSRAEISNIETGRRMPGRKSAKLISGILEFDWRDYL